jgi:hypothetical protein
MKTRIALIGGVAVLAGLAGTAAGGVGCGVTACGQNAEAFSDALAHPDELALRAVASRLLPLMPREEREKIIAAGGIGSEGMTPACTAGVPSDITPREYMDKVISPELAARMTEVQWKIANGVLAALERGEQPPALCFAPDTDPEYAYAINQMIEFPLTVRFQQTNRWTRTAVDGAGLSQGVPTTITYSYVPDGTFVPNLIGVTGSSTLFSWMNGLYGDPATWQALFDQVFDRWSDLIGTTYIFEPNDDGANLNNAIGVVGVRGDVRIAAINIDGGGGVLAYNNFPNDGDMVLDANDSFYNNFGSNSLRLRNIIAHEHGHGLGMLHVCPANQTKLMEPFISTAYNGPQLDDILNGHRHYGDPMEPDTDNPATAPDLGTFGVGGLATVANASVDGTADQDFYSITLSSPSQLQITVGPDAGVYLQGGQTQQCNTGTNTDYTAIRDLQIDVFSPANPFAPLATANATGLGGFENLNFDAEQAGEYLVRVSGSGADNVQRYAMTLFVADLPFLEPQITFVEPASVDPGVPTTLSVDVDPREDVLVGAPQVFSRVNGGSFTGSPMVNQSGTTYLATLPAVACGDTLEYYFSAEGATSGTVTLPPSGSADPFQPLVGDLVTVFEDDFETDKGWSVSGAAPNAASGRWERAVPAGDGSRGDAPNDFDGSGRCYVTGNGGPGSNTDVDGGDTVLTSPALDLTGVTDATISYARWYDNTGSGTGAAPGADTFKVQVSNNNGSSWTQVEVVGPSTAQSSGGWFTSSFRVEDFVAQTAQVRVRFIADDLGSGSVIEAAVDAVQVVGVDCEDPNLGCSDADLADPFGVLNFFDLSAYLALFNAGDPSADLAAPFGTLNFFDLSAYLTLFNAGCP